MLRVGFRTVQVRRLVASFARVSRRRAGAVGQEYLVLLRALATTVAHLARQRTAVAVLAAAVRSVGRSARATAGRPTTHVV